jgi:hypothetical protein
MLTQAELAAIEARLRAATPGPWYASNALNEYAPFCDIVAQDANESWVCEKYSILDGIKTEDCEFIAYARADIPALLAHVRELQAQVDAERWRDVAQEPPVNDGYLTEPLLFIVDDVVEQGRRVRYTDGQWHWWDEEGCECHGITHWKPWPKPPKEAQE